MEQFYHNILIQQFSDKEVFYGIMVILLVIQEIVVRIMIGNIKIEYRRESEKMTDPREIEEATLQYHGKRQRVTVARIIGISVMFLTIASYIDVRSALAAVLPIAAVMVTFKETIVSFFTYFYILAHFRIGDDIRVGEAFGEVLSIQPTRTLLQMKDSDGEFTGRATEVPNYFFATQPVSKQEAKYDTHRLVRLDVPFIESIDDFTGFNTKLRAFLDELLPLRNARNVGHFRSFAGVRYKLDWGYHDKGHLLLKISFVSHPSHINMRKEEIISFIEALRAGKNPPINETNEDTKLRVDKKKK